MAWSAVGHMADVLTKKLAQVWSRWMLLHRTYLKRPAALRAFSWSPCWWCTVMATATSSSNFCTAQVLADITALPTDSRVSLYFWAVTCCRAWHARPGSELHRQTPAFTIVVLHEGCNKCLVHCLQICPEMTASLYRKKDHLLQ